MRLPDNKLLAWLVLICPPLVATALPLLALRGALFYEILGAAFLYLIIQVLWSMHWHHEVPDLDEYQRSKFL